MRTVMLKTLRGMWHSTHELPALPAWWRVCGVTASRMSRWAWGRTNGFADRLMAVDAQSVAAGSELRIAVDIGDVRIAMAGGARRAAAEKALALPEPQCVVGEATRTAIGPVRRVRVFARPVFE